MMGKLSKSRKILNVLKDAGLSTTFHGFSNIIRANRNSVKFLWIVSMMVSCGVCSFLLTKGFSDFFSWDVVTKIDIIAETPSIFPTITICNANPLINNFSVNFSNGILEKEQISDPLNFSIFEKLNLPNQEKLFFAKYLVVTSALNPDFPIEDRKKLGINIDETVISCMYNLNYCDKTRDIDYFYDDFHGSCLKFNTDKTALRKANKPGIVNGLQLELIVGEPNQYSLSTRSGLFIIVHNSSSAPVHPQGFTVPVGMHVNIEINREFIIKKTSPYSECNENLDSIDSFDSDLFREIIKTRREYKREHCFDLCFQQEALIKCGCQDPASFRFHNKTICSSLNKLLCIYDIFSKFYANDVKAQCVSKCPLECNTVRYPVSLSYLEYPTKEYSKILFKDPLIISHFLKTNQKITHKKLKKNIVSLNFYYGELKYTKIEEVIKITWIDFLSSIGGTLGLFIGISFLSMIEIFEVICHIIFILFEKKQCKLSNNNGLN